MNDSKSKCFSPTLSEADVRAEGLPRALEVTRSGTRVLGGAVGSLDFCRSFATDIVEEVVEDFEIIGRMSSLQAQHCLAISGVKWGARVLRVRSVSREEARASAGVQGAWVDGCGCGAD